MTYDSLMRLPLAAWCALLGAGQLAGLYQFMNAGSVDFVYVIHVAMRLSTVAFMLLIAAAAILRSRPSAKARGLEPRISALVGSFLVYGMMLFPRRDLSLSAEIVSTLLILIGSTAAIVALSQLGRSFSVMAETRGLVTRGPYRFVRHPLYVAEEIAILGVFMQFASMWAALLLAVQIAFQLRRMHHEEAILSATFSDYDAYRRNTPRLIPGVY
jgi:protein-S-isoprenylcysteine O-methyltransferase Ste14